MAESNVIREFLVALGFKTDESALKNFETGITKASKAVFGLGAAIEGTAIAVSVGVARWASGLESLYFASIKANTSATNLRAFDRAAQNMGTQAGEAAQSVQALARYLRTNPGGEGFLSQFGIQTRSANGHLKQTTELLTELAPKLRSMPYYMANQYAGIFGISEDTLRAMMRPDFAQQVQSMQDKMKHSGFDKAASDAHQFGMRMRDLQTNLEAFGNAVYDALAKKLGFSLDQLNDWMQKNGPQLATKVAADILWIINLAEQLYRKVKSWVTAFMDFDAKTGGLAHKVLEVAIALKMFGGFEIVSGVLKLAGAFGRLAWAIGTVGTASTATGAAAGLGGLLARLGLVGARLSVVGAAAVGIGTGGYAIYKGIKGEDASNWASDLMDKAVTTMTGGKSKSLGDFMYQGMNGGKEALAQLRMQGWSEAQARGILANVQAESGGRADAVGDNGHAYGLGQWHEDRQAMFKKLFGIDIHKSDASQQLQFMNWELHNTERRAGDLLRAATNSQQAARIVSLNYERPAGGAAEADRRAGMAVSVSSNTTIHVKGSGDTKKIARDVANEQRTVNAELVRNLQPNVQ
jgi:hypothetical protein